MKLSTMMCTLLCTLSLLTMGPVYATSPQKSTIVLINGDDVSPPYDCKGDMLCLLAEDGIDYAYEHGAGRLMLLDPDQVDAACEILLSTGGKINVLTLAGEVTCD